MLLYRNPTRQEGLFPMEKSDPILITIFQLFSRVQAGCTNYFIALYRCVDIFSVSVVTWPSKTASWTSCGRKRASLTCLVRCVVLSLKNLISRQNAMIYKVFQILNLFFLYTTQVTTHAPDKVHIVTSCIWSSWWRHYTQLSVVSRHSYRDHVCFPANNKFYLRNLVRA